MNFDSLIAVQVFNRTDEGRVERLRRETSFWFRPRGQDLVP